MLQTVNISVSLTTPNLTLYTEPYLNAVLLNVVLSQLSCAYLAQWPAPSPAHFQYSNKSLHTLNTAPCTAFSQYSNKSLHTLNTASSPAISI